MPSGSGLNGKFYRFRPERRPSVITISERLKIDPGRSRSAMRSSLTVICSKRSSADSDEGDHYSDLMAITIPSDADHRRSEATLSYSYHP
jgi:hypothetical protein